MTNLTTSNTDIALSKAVPVDQFRHAMRELAGAVCVITVGNGPDRTGFVATSVSSFSANPPILIMSIDRGSSSWKVLSKSGRFGVNFMREDGAQIAYRFSGFGGVRGNERYQGAEWTNLASGTSILENALASVDCIVEETIDRYDHVIVLGKVESIRLCETGKPLLWFQSRYHSIGEPLQNNGL